jgi:hypothetical protein
MALLPEPTSPTVAAIYRGYEETARGDGMREHLGASIVGNECERALFYSFRWATRIQHAGRLLRLFATGHLEEDRLVKDLRRAGVTVMEVDPSTGRQWSVAACDGHFGGSMDAIVLGLLEAPKTYHLAEFKTHSQKSFSALQKHGLEKSKPMHWAQMQIYMSLGQLDRGVYLAVNKNTDEIYLERVKPDPVLAARLLAKAERVIKANEPPAKVADNADCYLCKFCDHRALCWEGALAERNCRTCINSTPIAEGKWHCASQDAVLTGPQQRRGCMTSHRYLPGLVAGEQVDVRGDAIVYQMKSGEEWVDSGA